MIRFIASDLDGTLLDRQGRLPEEIFPLIARLSARGILFAPASGRQYANLCRLFAPVREHMLFICENGALVKREEKTLFVDPIPVPLVKGVLDAVRQVPGLYPILCGTDNAYVESDEEPFFTRAREPYTNCFKTDNLDDCISREPVCKISIYDPEGSRVHAMKILPGLLKGVQLTPSGEHWCDVAAPGANKGNAILEIQKILGITKDECMAFGDHMNDEGMLRACGHPRAVANAVPAILGLAEKVIPANTEGGVLTELEALLEEIGG